MSAEYYSIEEMKIKPKLYSEYTTESVPSTEPFRSKDSDCGSASTKKGQQDDRLHEIEEQLQMAENRCNTLKGQLDFMKKVYHKANDQPPSENQKQKDDDKSTGSIISTNMNPDIPPQKTFYQYGKTSKINKQHHQHTISPSRHHSNISTDTTGAAVRTINNILTGITDSVNRLSELHAHIGTDGSRKQNKLPNKPRSHKNRTFIPDEIIGVELVNFKHREGTGEHISGMTTTGTGATKVSETSIIEEMSHKGSEIYSVKLKTNSKKRPRLKTFKPTAIIKTSACSLNNKKNVKVTARHVEKKHTINPVRTGMYNFDMNQRKQQLKKTRALSRTLIKRKLNEGGVKSFRQYTTDNLIELYHNKAAKSSDSEESNNAQEKSAIGEKGQRTGAEEVPPLKINISVHSRKDDPTFRKKPVTMHNLMGNESTYLTPIVENDYSEPAAPRADVNNSCSIYSRNYELPTISSKMKQVAKCYLHSFNFKSIPFCAAKSTTPSHNIGINIQQVMSIIKTRQPLHGISPTLAHNIGLAAEKLHNRPLTTLASSISSRMTTCPLIRNTVNFQQLQEMAKEIVEEDEAVGDKQDNGDSPNCVMMKGASGDAEKEDKKQTVWTADLTKNKTCTCVIQSGMGFQQVLSKYHSNQNSSTAVYSSSHTPATMPPLRACRMSKRQFLQPPRTKKSQLSSQRAVITNIRSSPETTHTLQQSETIPLKGREKTLKEVLNNLHNDFEALNTKYEELSTQAREGAIETNEETLKQLEEMEKNLNNKEEEIKMVMALYKEVVALKQQVKVLKDRTSQASFPVKEQMSRYKDYKDPSAAMHLTKLLRQIQNYQVNFFKR